MGYFKLIPYVFLLIAVVFLIDAITRLNNGEDPIISFLFTAVAIFMFFFRRHHYKKFDSNSKK
jgi:c-di-AMP phosphodiesterase-like protein